MEDKNESKEAIVSFFLRAGLALVFLYAAVSSMINPSAWIGYIPSFVGNIERAYLLQAHAIFEIILGLWLLSNKKIFYASLLAGLSMVAIVVFNLAQLDVIFRDVAILFMAIALAFLSYKGR